MANKKILYVITKASIGGATRYVRDLAVSFKDEYKVVVAAGEGDWLFGELEKENIKTIKLSNVGRDVAMFSSAISIFNPIAIYKSVSHELKTLYKFISLLKKERPDILHLNSSKIGGLGALAGRIVGTPKIIFTAHGWAYNEKRSFFSRVAFFKLHALTMLLSHTTIANSLHTYKTAPLKKGLRKIYLGVKEPVLLTKGQAKEKLKTFCPLLMNSEHGEKVSIGIIAELHTNKGVDVLIEAIPNVDENVNFILIGGGDLENKLKNSVRDLSIEDRVCFTGALENAAQYMDIFDIFVLPSRTESLGYVFIEAGLAGKPVVATNVGGIPEVIEDKKTGILVKKENSKELAEAINALTKDKQKRTQFGAALKDSVSNKFSFEKMILETREIYTT